ncbi:MAG: bifunctional [glutamate--ammonia ligase]-adenylyl-L-tyrosine phosphorylase/[glutamate--ammonia-ligase] adenylyltransferase [Thermodesulfovibrio sp.]|nr:bifunctional [glutamate--ammonia ligase]-adenylyl-L-tyrosine phosphorylase/[glutamate--ammonia-ligase] adenylyltransferase [Thermodesulfovibrio sp.]
MTMTDKLLKDAAATTPDPARALNNLRSFIEENPAHGDELHGHLREIAALFSVSQFLSNFSITNPDLLFWALHTLDVPPVSEEVRTCLREEIEQVSLPKSTTLQHGLDPFMQVVRQFRLKQLLKITLRDILRRADLTDTFIELSMLADVVTGQSLKIVRRSLAEQYGLPQNDGFSVIALGKLGAEELNFSSDIDLMYVYGDENGETSGVVPAHGITKNRISNHEFYCRVGEALSRFLSLNTESGFCYRVDMRLRPEGQRGALALSLRGYETYYESWGRAWERAMLIRARPIAGDRETGEGFMKLIQPFVYRKYLDFSAIDEIKSLKIRIDATFKKGDIKRGYGGIREIEFFTQALQLIYGGRETRLRERNTLKTLHTLMQKSLIGQEDYAALTENYRFFRIVEHRLQQLNDIQTHTLPVGSEELNILALKLGLGNGKIFAADLEKRRNSVRRIYDSLFAAEKEAPHVERTFFDEEFSDAELREYFSEKGFKDSGRAVRNLRAIKDSIFSFQTLRGRRLLNEILPLFVDSALKSAEPEEALNYLQSFAGLISTQESYLEIFIRDRKLIDMLIYVFSHSAYLTKVLISRPRYLEMIGWQEDLGRSLRKLQEEVWAGISDGHSINETIRLVKQSEEIRLGLLFMQQQINVWNVVKGLSRVAEAVLSVCLGQISGAGSLAVIGLGKLGGREITFGSDIDLVFVTQEEATAQEIKAAEKLLSMLTSYTKEGVAYRVDTRLRPEGSKGPLVSSVSAFRKYYDASAQFWELQALLRARPLAGDSGTRRLFMSMAKDALMTRGRDVAASDILHMRQRILQELSREREGYDIKLGAGGLEELEFTIQFLQLRNCSVVRAGSSVLVQNTMEALRRLALAGKVAPADAELFSAAYLFFRRLESFMRLRGSDILRPGSSDLLSAAIFLGYQAADMLEAEMQKHFLNIGSCSNRYLRDV